jgi:hypothetical protein
MFNTKGIAEAHDASVTQATEMARRDAEKERCDQERNMKLKVWSVEALGLWRNFQRGDEYRQLKESLKTFGCDCLHVYKRRLEFYPNNTQHPFVIAWTTGGYFSQRVATPHSSKGYFSSIANLQESPQEAFDRLLSDLDKAFENEKHRYRYWNDRDYRVVYDQKEAEKRRAEGRKANSVAMLALVVAAMFGYYLFY